MRTIAQRTAINIDPELSKVIEEAKAETAKLRIAPEGENDEARIRRSALADMRDASRAMMSPPGALGLPTLLEQRRWEALMIDAAFVRQCVYDRVLVYQIDMHDKETFTKDGMIVMPDSSKQNSRTHAARGILVSAGLKAMDTLRSYGMELGHVVNFINSAPWRLTVDFVSGKPFDLLVMNVGDLVASEDLRAALLGEKLKVIQVVIENKLRHVYSEDGTQFVEPLEPWTPDDH